MDRVREYAFPEALGWLRPGGRIYRACWRVGKAVHLQVPDANSKMTVSYLFMQYDEDRHPSRPEVVRVPWQPTQEDMGANDWVVEM